MASLTDPCQFCKTATSTSNIDGPICDTCMRAFLRGRAVGIGASVTSAQKHGATDKVIDELKKLF